MNLPNDEINRYCEEHTSPEGDLLTTLSRETYLKMLMPNMLSGHLQGRLLAMISKMINPSHILEIGTFTGYSSICMAEGLKTNGKLFTIDINEELESTVRHYIEKSGNGDKIEFLIGNALEIIPTLDYTFDLIFIDADKENYSTYYDLIIDSVRKGGIIIADNTLWSGKVLDTEKYNDVDTVGLREFNKKITKDERVENLLLPVRDGLMILQKK